MTPDQDLSARLNRMTFSPELNISLYDAYRSGQLITLADHQAAVAKAVEAERAREVTAYKAGMHHAERVCRFTAEKVTDRVNWAHNCAVFIGITCAELDDTEVAAAIRSRGVE